MEISSSQNKVHFNKQMTDKDVTQLKTDVREFNRAMDKPADPEKEGMGKNDFLKLLVTQLSHQDPLNPMKNQEFIAQMAQFSSLEQMHNVSKSVGKLSSNISRLEAQSIIGKNVTYIPGNLTTVMNGEVEALRFSKDGTPTLVVDGEQVNMQSVRSISRTPLKDITSSYEQNAGASVK